MEFYLIVGKREIKAKRQGELTSVKNKNRYPSAAEKYNYLRVQSEWGKEYKFLFTDFVIKRAKTRADKNPEDLPNVSWFREKVLNELGRGIGSIADLQIVVNKQRMSLSARRYNHVRVNFNGKKINLLFTDNEIKIARVRAKKNPEDLPEVSWLRDILD